jgi:hypothetical protein
MEQLLEELVLKSLVVVHHTFFNGGGVAEGSSTVKFRVNFEDPL